MHSTTSTAVALLSLVASSYAADTTTAQSIPVFTVGTDAPISAGQTLHLAAPNQSSLVSELLAQASSQVNDPKIKSELSTISAASGVDIPKAIASAAQVAVFSTNQPISTPAWVAAAGSTGAVASIWSADIAGLRNQQASAAIAAGPTSMATNVTSSLSSGTGSSTGSSSAAQGSASSSNSQGGAASQPTGAIMAVGAAAAGVLGFAAML